MEARLSIADLLMQQAATAPNAPAILSLERSPLSYAGLQQQCHQLVATLNGMGIGRNDCVAIVLPNGPEMAVAFLGVAACATSAPLNPAYRAQEFDFYLDDLKAKAVMVAAGEASPVRNSAIERGLPLLELTPDPTTAGLFTLAGVSTQPSAATGVAQSDDIALILHTSGTTARPKMVPLTQRNLLCSARNIGATLALSPADRCLNIMPLFHIHGLVAALLASLAAGGSVVCAPGFDAARFFPWLHEQQPTWYTAVPTMHQAILARAAVDGGAKGAVNLRFVRSSSASLPPTVMTALEALFNAPVIEAYGMTEAAHQMASNPLPPLLRKPGSVGMAAGPAIAIMAEEQDTFLPTGAIGEVVIRGDSVTAGYLNQPTANAKSFAAGWFRTGDQGYLDAEGYLYLTGRLKEIINRGGEKIAPREVDEVLLLHPAVAQALTFAVPHASLGEDVAAAVVLQPGEVTTERALRHFAFAHLADYKVPTQILLVDEIPKGPTGKLQRIGLADKLAGQLVRTFIPPSTPMEETLVQIWQLILNQASIGVADNFFALGGDSLAAARVVAHVRAHFAIELPLSGIFQEPTLSEQARLIEERIANLSPAKRALLEQYLQTKATAHIPTPIIPRRKTDQALPLSFAQQRLWFLQQLRPEMTAYHETSAFWLRGPLQLAALQQSLNELIARHEVLRTTYVTHQGIPLQVINPPRPLALPLLDLCHLPLAEREAHIQQMAYAENRQPFDLTTDLMQRAKVLRFSAEAHLLLLTSHHIATDGWSNSIFWRELVALYGAFIQDQPSPLPPLPIQYADYALWQRQTLQTDTPNARLAQLLRYWQTHLAGAPPLLELPLDFPRPSEQQAVGKTWHFSIPLALTEALKTLALQEEATLFMLLLAAFQVLLMRYTQQTDLVVGTPIANRQLPEVEGLIGMFVNTLALRADLAGNPPFRTFLQQVRSMALAAYEHQDVPFEKLVEVLQPQRNLQYHPLVQVAFALQNTPDAALQLPGLQVTPAPLASETAKFDLYLSLTEIATGLDGCLEYDAALWEPATIERMAGHFATLVAEIVAQPACPIEQLPLLTSTECQQLSVTWNQTTTDAPDDKGIHHRFEEQVERAPDTIAVVFAEAKGAAAGDPSLASSPDLLTYGELNARANQLAHYLQAAGVGPETLVGICMERSIEMVVGLLGILKAGGAYVPLDPTYPQERLAFMLQDTNPPVLLTQARLQRLLPTTTAQVICLDQDWPLIARQASTNPQAPCQADQLAYVIYTSGSTGQPKGAMLSHHNVLRLFTATEPAFHFNAQDVWTLFHSYAFDFSVWEMWGALLYGGRLVVVPYWLSRAPEEFYALLGREKVTVLNQTPSAFQQLMAAETTVGSSPPLALRLVIFGGEALDIQSLRPWFERHGEHDPQLVNMYGITETTVHVTYHPLCMADLQNPASVIGHPIADLSLYVLDKHQQPVPIGVAGELYVGGAGVGRGYLNRPDLTAERFLKNPFGAGQLYKTGDWARRLATGEFVYLGRLDQQVKMRGFRIELGEIEAALVQHPALQQAVVIVTPEAPDTKRLLAYIVVNPAHSPTSQELSHYLARKLPAYMLPAAFVPLERIPLTPNGKVDRRALPAPEMDRLLQTEQGVAPRSVTEKQLTELWKALLQLEQVGIHDNFFALGGHSLLTVQLVMQIKQQFTADLSLKHFLAGPTIAQLAAQIEQQKIEQQQDAPPQPASANLAPPPNLPPPLAELYDTVGVPSALNDFALLPKNGRWQLIHRGLRMLPRPLRLPVACQLNSPLLPKHLLRKRRQSIAHFLANIETAVDPELAIGLSLRYGLLDTHQVDMGQPGKPSLSSSASAQIERSRSAAKGVLLLLSHTTLQQWWKTPPIVQAHIGGAHRLTAKDDPNHAAITDVFFTRQVEYAHQILQEGGVAQIAADGQQGQGTTLLYNFHGRRRPFMTGFAELALATGAQVIAVTYTIAPTGEASFGLSSPLDPGAATLPHHARVERLVAQYVAHLSQLWAEAPWLVPWYQMEHHLVYPAAHGSATIIEHKESQSR